MLLHPGITWGGIKSLMPKPHSRSTQSKSGEWIESGHQNCFPSCPGGSVVHAGGASVCEGLPPGHLE